MTEKLPAGLCCVVLLADHPMLHLSVPTVVFKDTDYIKTVADSSSKSRKKFAKQPTDGFHDLVLCIKERKKKEKIDQIQTFSFEG